MVYVGKLESKSFPGFYYVPGLDRVLIDINGHVIDLKRKCCPLPIVDVPGYLSIYVNNKTRHIHRLLALTFIDVPENLINKAIVNHIDGNKLNNHLSNLEWVNHSGNIIHAYRNGLRTDNRPVLIKDIRTNEITRFYSVSELARKMNVDPSLVVVYLRPYNRNKLAWNFYVLIYEGEEWPVIDTDQIGKHRNGTAKDVVIININTSEMYIFESLGIACKELGMNYSATAMHMWRHKEKPRNGFVFKYIDDPSLYSDIIA